MLKFAAVLGLTGLLTVGGPGKPASTTGSWAVDTRHSDAKLTTDGTTDFGKSKIDVVLGFGRVNGTVKLDDANPSNSQVHLHIYPATSMTETIGEKGDFKSQWLANQANQTLVCFRSKQVTKTSDGKLQVMGELKLTRVDRNVDATPSEAYAGPVYGPPIIHSVSKPATFVFDLGPSAKGEGSQMSGSTNMTRESFPQLVKAVVNTYWPPLVQNAKCETPPSAGEDYRGAMCTGTVLQPPALPQGPYAGGREDYPGPGDYNAVSGNKLDILVHLYLMAPGTKGGAATGE
jgi:polyisoprenoid-binding protein YceI